MNLQEDYMNVSSDDFNCSTAFDRYEFTIVAIVNMVVGLLSFIISCFTIMLIVVLKKWHFFSERLILYLTITALFTSLANILNRVSFVDNPSKTMMEFCIFGGLLTQVTAWMVLCSITSITVYIFLRIMFGKNTEKFEWLYVVFIFVFPLVFNWIPFIKTSYGRAGVWCWIRSFDQVTCEVLVFGKWLQFSLLYIPSYTTLVVLLVFYVLIIGKIYRKRKVLSGINNPHDNKMVRKTVSETLSLVAYPVIYFLLSLPLLLNRIHASLRPTEPSLALWYIAALTFPLQGACTGLIFTFNTVICQRMTWKELRSRTEVRSRSEKKHKVAEYPMKTDEISDSVAFSTVPRHHSMIDYTEYH